jgi:3-dehydroquinate synthase
MRIDQRISVEFTYPVVFTRGVFSPANTALLDALAVEPARAFCIVDENVPKHHPELLAQIAAFFIGAANRLALTAPPLLIPGGEAAKNDFTLIERLMAAMLDHRLDRRAYVFVIGGGAVLDAAGLAASLVHRGLRLVRIPTTVLSQNDGGVGVKNGVNFRGGKNALGTFAPPAVVVNDFDFLTTLPDPAWRGGVAEAFKVAIIRDRDFFDWLCKHAPAFRSRDAGAMEQLVVRCATVHLEHIRTSGDPFEFGSARPLDFGHWAAHKLELLSGFQITHGEAVGAGIALDSAYALDRGWLAFAEWDRIHRGLVESGLQIWFPEMAEPELFDGLREFQEHLGGDLCVTFPRGIGARQERHEIDRGAMNRALAMLRETASQPA